ncbi:hypothetical protein HanXRQr2_Chr17g0802251 [Helianthus annuus]|uniref:Uncharacterized protein n=1 Tax=Helianthus annuus TaxID=4232 RepID=A0A9K3DIQ7_HELAN|nr:hypothetical protein HanXRQr2_Chr17g0802251 [Helianthus annuus]KAJ0813118.1 hypothetical protein HanPSC8_Chr17g0769831 [Helianthus annuus]
MSSFEHVYTNKQRIKRYQIKNIIITNNITMSASFYKHIPPIINRRIIAANIHIIT